MIATGVRPRVPSLDGVEHPIVMRNDELLAGRRSAGEQVVILGAGGIAFDVAEFLTDDGARDTASFMAAWGVDLTVRHSGGLDSAFVCEPPRRRVQMLQRQPGRTGRGLGRTTDWIKRTTLERRGVQIIAGAVCKAIDDRGVHNVVDGQRRLLPADTVVLCAGQEVNDELVIALRARGIVSTVIGGATGSAGINAERAVEQGIRAALALRGT